MGGTIAIVGRPNVGKSTIFNRCIGERVSIVDDQPGVTRDRIYGTAQWLGQTFHMIDTGGIQLQDQPYQEEIRAQVQIAMQQADVILLVTNGEAGVSEDDRYIVQLLQRSKKPIVLAVNHIDDVSRIASIYEFYALGVGEPIAVSGVHGIGVGDVLEACMQAMPEKKPEAQSPGIKIAIIGQPNVGKSSIVNALLHEERAIVAGEQGTTRDATDTAFVWEGKPYVIIDTAGIRKRGQVYEAIEKYAVLRAMQAIERCDVAVFVLDGKEGIREQDKHVAGYAHDAGKPIVIVVNKWDVVNKDESTMQDFLKKIRSAFLYLSYAPVLFVSAKTHQRISQLLPEVDRVYENSCRRIATNVLNEVVADTQVTTPSPARNGKRFRSYYATQVAIQPPTFVFSCNDPKLMHFTYKRYLENQLRQAFAFEGTPLRIIARKKVSV